ncbi:MAG: stage V sporulation protein AD [Ruminococcus sp.]|nr:stage V sporulation protein AD [Ruminococcus sp.]
MIKRTGKYTLTFQDEINITGYGSVAGKKESEGPLRDNFDKLIYDAYAGQKSFELAECLFQQEAVILALNSAKKKADDIDMIFAGDLLNQCISSSYGLKEFDIPYLGQYGACSTMAQGLIMAAMSVSGGASNCSACVTSSHFCSAERQYRFPLEYGGQRTPSAQWTVTGSGCCVLEKKSKGAKIRHATIGRIRDYNISDLNNMGAAMAPAAAQTILDYLEDTGSSPEDYDLILTGDLGFVGSKCLYDILSADGVDIVGRHNDCGLMIYNRDKQDVHSGGSGCGCSASVLCSTILPDMHKGKYKNILFVATGALMSPTSSQQGNSIPAIAHLVNISTQ